MFRLPLGAALLAVVQFASNATAQNPVDPAAPVGRFPVQAYRDPAANNAQFLAWQQFLARNDGQWRAEWHAATGTPHAIYGTGLPLADWRENTLEEARRHAQLLMVEHAELLGLGTSEFRESIGDRMGRTWTLVYDQYFRGLPVLGGRADFRINMAGRVAMFGSVAWPIPADFVIVPTVDELMATAIAWADLAMEPPPDAPAGQRQPPRLVIWGDLQATVRAPIALAWEVRIHAQDKNGSGPIGRSYIDATNGRVLHFATDKHECGIVGCTLPFHGNRTAAAVDPVPSETSADTSSAVPIPTPVTVLGYARIGSSATAPLTAIPMKDLQFQVNGITYTTNANGVAVVDIATSTSLTLSLQGASSRLVSGASAPVASGTLVPGVPATLTFGSPAASPAVAAHTTTYAYIQSSHQFCSSIIGASPQMQTLRSIQPVVNEAGECNAYFTSVGFALLFLGGGSNCNNTAFSSVIAHEWGHALDFVYGGVSQWGGLGEAWADIVSLYLMDHPLIGDGFFTSGGHLRTGNNTRQYLQGSSFHDQGESFMGFAWKLRNDLAVQFQNRNVANVISNRIVLGSIVANAWNQPRAVLEVFIADDNDGNLANGTPHWLSLVNACNQHSLPIPWVMPPNDECVNAITVFPGLNGPFDNRFATASMPSFYPVDGADLWFRYTTGASGSITVSLCGLANFNSIIEIYSGSCNNLTSLGYNDDICGSQSMLTVPVAAGSYYIRVGSRVFVNGSSVPTGYEYDAGPFQMMILGSFGAPASSTPFGTGCGSHPSAFYEHFPSNTGFDLSGTAMRLRREGDHYVASAQGSYVAPGANAVVLPLGNDSMWPVTLNGRFPVVSNPPGFSVRVLEVCSNGFVSVGTGNSTSPVVDPVAWLNSPARRWGTWHDFDPTRPGSGQVKFEEIGNVAYITWDGVFSAGTNSPNHWQLQFNLQSGDVTMAWLSMSSSGQAVLVGQAGIGPSANFGNFNLSALLPGGFRVVGITQPQPRLQGPAPRFGTTIPLVTEHYPPSAPLGVMCLGIVGYWPGIDLGIYGAPGCRQFTALEATTAMFPSGGSSTYWLTVPHAATFQGLPVHAQTLILAPGANPLGLVVTNALGMYIGQ